MLIELGPNGSLISVKGAAAGLVMERTTFLAAVRENPGQHGGTLFKQREPGHSSILLAPNVDELLERLSRHGTAELPNVDIHLPDCRCDEIVQHIRDCYPDVLIAVVNQGDDHHPAMHVVASSAHGAPATGAPEPELHSTGNVVNDQGQLPYDLEDDCSSGSISSDGLPVLTYRQRQVITLLARGHSNKVIARQLGISPSTVKVHVHAAFRALGVHSRMAAAAVLRLASHDRV